MSLLHSWPLPVAAQQVRWRARASGVPRSQERRVSQNESVGSGLHPTDECGKTGNSYRRSEKIASILPMSSSPQVAAALLSSLRRRDPEVLAAVVQDHSRPLYRAARGLGFSNDEAEDLVQDVFATFLETLDRFEGRSQVRTWLFGILHRKVLERRRALYREEQTEPIDAVFESRFDSQGKWVRPPEDLHRSMESKEIGEVIRQCLEGLPAAQREVFVLREIEGFETPEICKILGVTVTNMGVLIHRARSRLRECITAKGWGAR